jgi:hypothetical protein
MTNQPPFARGARETADQFEADLDELREELEALLRKVHDPHYSADRARAGLQLELNLRRRFRDEIVPRLRRQEPSNLEQRIRELEEWKEQVQAALREA